MKHFMIFCLALSFFTSLAWGGSDSLTKTLLGCINESVNNNSIKIERSETNSGSSAIGIICRDKKAETLFEVIRSYSEEKIDKKSDGSIKIFRFFGKRLIPSQCVRTIRDPGGKEANKYLCIVVFDLNYSVEPVLDI